MPLSGPPQVTTWGVFFGEGSQRMSNRVSFVVDGFNLYHSLKEASAGPAALATRWLDLKALCQAHLYIISPDATLERVYYFSALAKHLEAQNPGLVARHEDYAEALRGTGVVVEFARFLRKSYKCPHCGGKFNRHEEKQTDVAIGTKVLELGVEGVSNTIVVVSGDSDLIPAIRTTRQLATGVSIWMGFPAGKGGTQLRKATHGAFTFSATQYAKHQLPDPVVLAAGRTIAKPPKW